MSSFGYGGSVRMNPEIKNEKFNTMFETSNRKDQITFVGYYPLFIKSL